MVNFRKGLLLKNHKFVESETLNVYMFMALATSLVVFIAVLLHIF